MLIRYFIISLLLFVLKPIVSAQVLSDTLEQKILLQTSKGDITVKLYNDTPKHRDNFLRLVRSGYYDGTLFHRVIYGFMAQAGDSTTRHAKPNEKLGAYSPSYTIDAEIVFPKHFHHRGALAAAREGDTDNPAFASSSSQFYLVYGKRFTDEQIEATQKRLDISTNGEVKLTPEMRKTYYQIGGTPHLDGRYTVFGEIVEGMDVLKEIQMVSTDENDRPFEDVKIIKAQVL